MKKFRFLLSLTTKDNDYQQEQARAAEDAARKLGVDLQILYAENDAITQSQQLLRVIQSEALRPDAILFEPVGGTALPQVAHAAAAAKIGWVVLNRDVDYLAELRKTHRVPLFAVTADHDQIGRIQGQQIGALLPHGGSILYLQGPADSLAAKQRLEGMYGTKSIGVQVKVMRAQWTEESAHKAIASWLRLSTSQDARIDLVAAQDDSMAMGARKSFQANTTGAARDRWLGLPFLGCDGLPKTGRAWVRGGLLAATVVSPPNTDHAIKVLFDALQTNTQPQERSVVASYSYPEIGTLAVQRKMRSSGAAGR